MVCTVFVEGRKGMRGNKGEWSEFYVLLKLLADGKIHAADENLKRLEKYFPIINILREENKEKNVKYVIKSVPNKIVELYINDEKKLEIHRTRLLAYAQLLYKNIKAGGNRSFEISDMNDVMSELECEKLKAPSTDKTDITVTMHDIETGYEPVVGFSIKSELGGAPTLLNASKATNFVYKVKGLDDKSMDEINSIETTSKIIDRINSIYEKGGELEYSHMVNETFSDNLMFIDSNMEKLIAELLLIYFKTNISSFVDLVNLLKEQNALGYRNLMLYEDRFKRFLCSVALGMSPSKAWDGTDEANGGYIVVTESGDVLAYHLYNRDSFKEYLLNNTRLERASTSRHDYASIYKDGKDMYINLNLQVRFK